jgi:hypothetical protein
MKYYILNRCAHVNSYHLTPLCLRNNLFLVQDDVGLAHVLRTHLNITYTDSWRMLSTNSHLLITPLKEVNIEGTYAIEKVNIRLPIQKPGADLNPTFKEHRGIKKTPYDVLARCSVLDLSHVNYLDFNSRQMGNRGDTSSQAIKAGVKMNDWDRYVMEVFPPSSRCATRKGLNGILNRSSSESFVLSYGGRRGFSAMR